MTRRRFCRLVGPDRLARVEDENTGGAIGCLEVHDLAASNLAAGRDRDIAFVQLLLTERMVDARGY
jgi:hypothetical protein